MKPYEALRAHLLANSGVTALVGTRIYAGMLPQTQNSGTFQSSIVFRREPSTDDRSLQSRVLRIVNFTIIPMATDYDAADNIADAIDAALDGFKGTMSGGLSVTGCRIVSRSDEPNAEFNIFAVPVGLVLTYQP